MRSYFKSVLNQPVYNIMSLNFLRPNAVLQTSIRTYIRKYKWKNEGIKYPGFTYYPRFPDFKDPPYEPTKLFRVQRIKPVKGNPYWEKKILEVLKLDGKANDVAIVKNMPETNALLWKVKHLVKITPITFPDGVPTDQDLGCTLLKENGQLAITRQLKPSPEVLNQTDEFQAQPTRLDGNTLRRDSRLRWLSGWSPDL